MRLSTRIVIAAVAGTAVVATAAGCSSSGSKKAADTKPVATISSLKDGISTTVALNPQLLSALTSLKVVPSPYGTAKISGANATFPITGGHVTVYKKGAVTPYVQGVIDHQGSGLNLTAGSTKVTLANFVVNPGNHSDLTGEVLLNGKPVAQNTTLFTLDGTTLKPITIDSAGVAKLTGTRVLLASGAAKLLNQTFKVNALKGGTLVGVATILANSK